MEALVLGATGYIGGALAVRLVSQGARVVGLVRSEEKIEPLRALGVEPLFGTLDDAELLTAAASRAEVAFSVADMCHQPSVRALIAGLAGSGKPLIHTSGGTVIADYAGGERSEAVFDEDAPVSPVPEKQPIRDVDLLVLQAAGQGVRSAVICPGVVYARGPGLRPDSKKIPMLVAKSRTVGAGVYVGRGENVWSNVHLDDLVDLFLLAAEKTPPGTYYYAEDGETSQVENARAISRGLGFEGRTISIPLDEAVREYGFMRAMMSFASNGRLRGKNSRRILGWSPRRPGLPDYIEAALKAER